MSKFLDENAKSRKVNSRDIGCPITIAWSAVLTKMKIGQELLDTLYEKRP